MRTKTRLKLATILSAVLILSGCFPAITASAEQISGETAADDGASLPDEEVTEDDGINTPYEEITEDDGSSLPDDEMTEDDGINTPDEEITEDDGIHTPDDEITEDDGIDPPGEGTTEDDGIHTLDDEITEDHSASEIPDKAPAFQAHIEFRMGYTVIGTFTDFAPDTTRIQTLYSLDGTKWQTGGDEWNLYNLNTDNEYLLPGLQNQPCLLSRDEPLKSYIDGKTDRFYLKLLITLKSGLSYETQTAVIERGGLQALPEGTQCRACFSSSVAVSEPDSALPYRYRKYARYHLTVPADAAAEDITALLPETLPVEIQLDNGPDFMAIGVVDCPVTWKSFSLPGLSAGETLTIPDAAEEITVPAGTQVSTPLGIFELEKPLSLDTPPSTDEVRLVLNVSEKSKNPAGVLKEDRDGLKIALAQKPTGASSMKAYILTEGESSWTELSGLSLSEEFNQPSTESSGYALLLRGDQEPYRSYLAAAEAGETPIPFFIALKIEGGIYDGAEIILPWPDVYDQLPDLPKIRGAQGNEGNAGADNKADSTESGQRPSLPQIRDDGSGEQKPPASGIDGNHGEQQQIPVSAQETDSPAPENRTASSPDESVPDTPSGGQGNPALSGQRPNLPVGADQEGAPKLVPPVVQAAADTEGEKSLLLLSGPEAAGDHTPKSGGRIPCLPMTIVVAAGCCIGAALYRAAGYSLFHRIAGKVRNILHR